MQKRLLCALTLTTCLTTPAAAENWRYINDVGYEVAYGDADSIARSGNSVSVNVLLSHAIDDFHSQVVEFDCSNDKFRIREATDLKADKTYLQTPEFETQWKDVSGTMSAMSAFGCVNSEYGTPVGDPFSSINDYWYYYYYDY